MSPDASKKVTVEVDGRTLTLSNLDKVLYPEVGFTKGEVLDYYTRIAPVLLPHIDSRPVTFKRYPDGVEGKFFFEKPHGTVIAGSPNRLNALTLLGREWRLRSRTS